MATRISFTKARIQLVNAGQDAAQKNQPENVLRSTGVRSSIQRMSPPTDSKVKEKEAEKDYLGQVALFAARYAYQAKGHQALREGCDIAMKILEQAKGCSQPEALRDERRLEESC